MRKFSAVFYVVFAVSCAEAFRASRIIAIMTAALLVSAAAAAAQPITFALEWEATPGDNATGEVTFNTLSPSCSPSAACSDVDSFSITVGGNTYNTGDFRSFIISINELPLDPTDGSNLIAKVPDFNIFPAVNGPLRPFGPNTIFYNTKTYRLTSFSLGSTTSPTNSSPVANAGADQIVASEAAVTLDGSASSDADGDTLRYTWSQTSGSRVTLSDVHAVMPTFTAPTLAVGDLDETLEFSLTVNDGTVDGTVDTVTITVQAPAPTPASEFAANQAAIREVIQEEAARGLQSTLGASQRMTRDARERFISWQRAEEASTEQGDVPLDVDGTFALNGTTLSTRGEFFEQTGNFEGTQRRLFFGDFDVQHDGDTGSTTATLTARVAWEQMTSDRTMLGYFIGGELASSNIDGAFEGDQDRVGVTAGGYAVHQLADQVYLDGFLSYGIGRNNLDMANDVLALTSDYTTRTATMGAALSGVYDYEQYEFRPELAFSYGHTWIGHVGFTGRAYGLVDDTLSLDAGNVSIANLTLRPEVIWALDADTVADSNSQFSFAPRLICERTITTTRTENCGGGAELGLSSSSEDGLSNAEIRFIRDRVGSSYRSSFALNLERRF
jgi:hypothetical protein